MLPLTKQERLVVIFFSLVFLIGTILQYIFKKIPHLKERINCVDRGDVDRQSDLNKTTGY